MDPSLLSVFPLVVAGALLMAAGLVVWMQGPRSPITVAFAVLLVFDGDLILLRALFLFPEVPAPAVRLWPLFEIVVLASAVAFLLLAMQRRVAERTMDAWLSSLIGGAALTGVLAVVVPSLYWGDGSGNGPLAFVGGLRLAALATVGWLLLRQPRMVERPLLALLGISFLLGPVFWVFTDMLYVGALGADLPNLYRGPAHWGRLVAVVPVVAALADLVRRWLRHPLFHERALASRLIVLVLLPALASVLLLDAIVLGLIDAVTADALLLWLWSPLWSLAVPLAVGVAAFRVPGVVGHVLPVLQGPPPAREAPHAVPATVHWD